MMQILFPFYDALKSTLRDELQMLFVSTSQDAQTTQLRNKYWMCILEYFCRLHLSQVVQYTFNPYYFLIQAWECGM